MFIFLRANLFFSSAADINSLHCANCKQRVTNARRGLIADMTPPTKWDGDGGIKHAMCQRPRAALRPMLALFVVSFKFAPYHILILFRRRSFRFCFLICARFFRRDI
jgi:hypothetical protein